LKLCHCAERRHQFPERADLLLRFTSQHHT
jgi:hypothetical protein